MEKQMSTENKTKLNESLLAAFNRVVSSKSGNLFAEAKKLNEISDTEIMNSDLYKNALKGRDPNKIQIGDEIEGLGKFEKGETIWSKTKAALAAKKAAPEKPVIEPNKKIPEFNVKQSVPGATPAPGPTGGYNTDRKPSDNSWVQDSAAAPASTTPAIPTNNKPKLTGDGGITGTSFSATDRQNLEYDKDKAEQRRKMNLTGTGL